MHEMSVAESVLRSILAEARKQKARPVAAKISCGVLNAVNDEALFFAFEAIAKGTTCEAMELEVEHKPIEVRCKKCEQKFEFDVASAKCNNCGGEDFDLLPDAPLILEEIEFEAE